MYPQTSSNQNWLRLLTDFDGFQGIYTDGLKAGAATRLQLPCQTSTNHLIYLLSESLWRFTFADHHGVRCSWWIPHTNIPSFFSCLQRIENSDQPLILKIVVTLHQLVGSSKRVIVVWLPSHTGLAGNMTIDAVVKVALNLAESQTPVPFTGFCPLMSTHIASLWQRLWNAKTNNKRISSHP